MRILKQYLARMGWVVLLFSILFILLFAGCSPMGSDPIHTPTPVAGSDPTPTPATGSDPTPTPEPGSDPTTTPDAGSDPISVVQRMPEDVQSMTLREKVGQMMFPAFRTDRDGAPLLQADEATLAEIGKWQPGGVILFSQNMDTVSQTAALIRGFQSVSRIPLFLGVDEEGGIVSRLSAAKGLGAVPMPKAHVIGAIGDEALAAEAALATARQLSVLGFNVDFAPVADVNTNPANPVIGQRAYGDTPELVGRMVTAAMDGFQQGGVAPVVKHFPGHGDTETDSHLGLAVVPHGRDRMDAVELAPFREAIAAGVPMIMTAHVNTPGISDKPLPATLNPDILTGLLRGELAFPGVIVTDAMEMGAITEHYGEAESLVMAVEAGADMLLVPLSLARACEALLQAVADGRISEARIDASVERILRMKHAQNLPAGTEAFMNTRPEAIPDVAAHRALVERILAAGDY